MLFIEDACKPDIAFMRSIFKTESYNKRILWIVLLLILLFIWLLPPIHATSWYANVGSWEIERQSETISFELQDYYSGNITGIEATPKGRMVSGVHSRYINIDLNDVSIRQRRSAFQGDIKSERYTKLSAEAEEPITREILKPSGTPFYEFNFTEVWPVHLQSDEAVVYSGMEINDLDLAANNLDFVASSFLQATDLSEIKRYSMELERLNITLIANDVDVTSVNFQPSKHLNYGIEAFNSGKTHLLYRQTAEDMVTTINEGDQSFFGDYTLKASISMGAINKRKQTDFQLDCCGFSQVV